MGYAGKYKRVGRRLDYRAAHEDWSVDQLPARERIYGGGPSRFADPDVLARARELLESGRRHESIARELGYSTIFAFSAAFKTATGESPRAFQRRAVSESGESGCEVKMSGRRQLDVPTVVIGHDRGALGVERDQAGALKPGHVHDVVVAHVGPVGLAGRVTDAAEGLDGCFVESSEHMGVMTRDTVPRKN